MLLDISLGDDFLDLVPKAKKTKAKISGTEDGTEDLKHKKGNHQQNKQATSGMGEKYLQIILSDKGSIFKRYEELIELNSKITVQLRNGYRT